MPAKKQETQLLLEALRKDVGNFFAAGNAEVSGEQLVDAERFKDWAKKEKLSTFPDSELEPLRKQLELQYSSLINPETSKRWTGAEFSARWGQLKTSTFQDRYKQVGLDYARSQPSFFPLPVEWHLALALSITYAHAPLQKILEGIHRTDINGLTWFTAKAGQGIRSLGRRSNGTGSQRWTAPLAPDGLPYSPSHPQPDDLGPRHLLRADLSIPQDLLKKLFFDQFRLNPSASAAYQFPEKTPAEGAPLLRSFVDLPLVRTLPDLNRSRPGSSLTIYIELFDKLGPFPAAKFEFIGDKFITWAPGVPFSLVAVKGEPTRHVTAYIRPQAWWGTSIGYMTASHVKRWVKENLTGDKLMDKKDYPGWDYDGSLREYLASNPPGTAGKFQKIVGEVKKKYTSWIRGPASIEKSALIDRSVEALVVATRSGRYKLLADAYLDHIKRLALYISITTNTAPPARRPKGLRTDYSLAISIYTSSEYSSINKLARGQESSAEKIHVWLNAKTAVAINFLGRKEKWIESHKKGQSGSDVPGYIASQISSVASLHGFKPALRRDESESFPMDLFPKIKSGFEDEQNPEAPGRFYTPGTLWSTTTKLAGVKPFNEITGTPIWIIDISEANNWAAIDVAAFSAYPAEAEILWRRRQKFRIVYISPPVALGPGKDRKGENPVPKIEKPVIFLKARPFPDDPYPVQWNEQQKRYVSKPPGSLSR